MGCSSSDESHAAPSGALAQQASTSDAGTTSTGPLSGSAAAHSCAYFSRPDGGTCNGYYCGVTEAQLAAAMPPDSVCGDANDACTGALTDKLTGCTRDVVIANLGTPTAELKSKIEECMWADPITKENVKPACLGCFVDSAICIVDGCLMECASEGPACDVCRKEKNCVQGVFACAGLPSPL